MLDYGWALATFTVAFVAIVSIAAGPLFGSVGLAAESDAPPGSGTAAVDVRSVPETDVALERGRFGAETYHLAAPDAVVAVDGVRGNPTIRYAIDVPGLWFSDVRTYEARDADGRELRMNFRPAEINPSRVTEDRYEGTLAIWLHERDDEYTLVYERTIVIEARRSNRPIVETVDEPKHRRPEGLVR
ncbi:hypothetical protein [Halegenticoccus tardaugens]|uniref:hypothetical protein n=1 Tax=Halegenticoccus tardaugens TaxID=2071624 RepID=UPI00100BC221|nr:hypothetical protein [Halegenticoccus tardaugens]